MKLPENFLNNSTYNSISHHSHFEGVCDWELTNVVFQRDSVINGEYEPTEEECEWESDEENDDDKDENSEHNLSVSILPNIVEPC